MPSGVGIALGILGIGSLNEQRKARKEQKKARAIDEKRLKLQSQRQAVEQIRQGQIARAQIIAQGEAQGAGGSSAVIGGAGSVQSQTASNVAFAQQIFQLQQLARQRLDKAQDFAFRGASLETLANTASRLDLDKMFAKDIDSMGASGFGSTRDFSSGTPVGGV